MNWLLYPINGFYLAGTIGYLVYLFAQKEAYHRAAYALILAGFLTNTGLIVAEYLQDANIPVRNLHETLVFAAWVLTGVFLLVRYQSGLKILGVFAAPLITIMTAAALYVPDTAVVIKTPFDNVWLVVHVILVFIGEASLALACGTGILYLIQEHSIKGKRLRFFFKRLPSLDLLDGTGYAFIVLGFSSLTVGLITGFVYARSVWGHFWSGDPKEVWSGITWLIYAALLHERLVAGWRGRRAAIFAIIGFAAVLFTFFGVNFFLKGHHHAFTRW